MARALIAILLAACGSRVTYHADIAPLVAEKCAGCHEEGGVAGLDLTTYEAAKSNAALMKAMTSSRRMPPYLVDASGECGDYTPDGHLDDAQIAAIAAWAEAGAPEGPRVAAVNRQEAKLSDTTTLGMEEAYTPALVRNDDYRCFVVDPKLATDRFLTGYEVHPGEARTVHHVILFASDSAASDQAAIDRDAAEPGYGYTCFGGSGLPESRPVAAWAPGTRLVRYPEGTGVRLLAGRKLVMQVHYNLHQGTAPDSSRIDLELKDAVENEAIAALIADTSLVLPPGRADAGTSMDIRLRDLGVPLGIFIRGVYPHMHTTGRSLRFTLTHEGEERCIAAVPRWDFHSQQFYFYSSPLYVYPQDTLRLECHYDTTDRTSTTRWGEGTEDEMCLMGAYVTLF